MVKIFSVTSTPSFTPGSGLGQGDGQIDAQIIFFDVFYQQDGVDFNVTECNDEE